MANDLNSFILFCCLNDEPDRYFSVTVNKDATVDGLKKAILTDNPDIGLARHLDLWKVSIPDDELDVTQEIIRDPRQLDGSTLMQSLKPLSAYFATQPPGQTLHIIVGRGSSECTTED